MAFSFTKITPFGNAINDVGERWQKEVLLASSPHFVDNGDIRDDFFATCFLAWFS